MDKKIKGPNTMKTNTKQNLESIIAETGAAPPLPPPATSQTKDERPRHPVATVCRRRHLLGPSPTGVSPWGMAISTVERLPPGSTTSKDSMNIY